MASFQISTHLNQELICPYGVRATIFPAVGKRSRLKLNRTRIRVSLSSGTESKVSGTHWVLPGLGRKGEFFIEFIAKSSAWEQGVYRVNAVTAEPFKMNGNYCLSSYLQVGDKVSFGLNELSIGDQSEVEHDQIEVDEKLADSELPILIQGKTGSGKSYLANRIHEKSGRLGKFIQVNIASFSPSLIESELFGHVKGAFTGANHDRMGAFQSANRGTLFIDEVDSLSLDMQTKLLLFLDNLKVRAVGSTEQQQCYVRLIFATGRDLTQLVNEGKMRADFYFRLKTGFSLRLPSLKDSKEKISTFCEQFELKHDVRISRTLLHFYQGLAWPGNYRQLGGHLLKKKELAVGRVIELDECDRSLALDDSIDLDGNNLEFDRYRSLHQVKNDYAKEVYFKMGGNTKDVCKVLSIAPSTLRGMKKDWGELVC